MEKGKLSADIAQKTRTFLKNWACNMATMGKTGNFFLDYISNSAFKKLIASTVNLIKELKDDLLNCIIHILNEWGRQYEKTMKTI